MATIELAPAIQFSRDHRRRLRLLWASRRLVADIGLHKAAAPYASESGFTTILLMLSDIHRAVVGARRSSADVPASVAAAGGGGDGEHSHGAVGGMSSAAATSGARCSNVAAVASTAGEDRARAEAASGTSMAADVVTDRRPGSWVAPQEPLNVAQANVEVSERRGDELTEGCVVRVVGLLSKTQYNDKEGRLGKFIPRTGRWMCNLHDGSALQIKSANLEPLSRTPENSLADTSAGATRDMANGQRHAQSCSDACSADCSFPEQDVELVRAFANCDATLARDRLREHGGDVLAACDSLAHVLLDTGPPQSSSPLF